MEPGESIIPALVYLRRFCCFLLFDLGFFFYFHLVFLFDISIPQRNVPHVV